MIGTALFLPQLGFISEVRLAYGLVGPVPLGIVNIGRRLGHAILSRQA